MATKETMRKLETEKVEQLNRLVLLWEKKAMNEEGKVINEEAYGMWQVLKRVRNQSAGIADQLSKEIAEERAKI